MTDIEIVKQIEKEINIPLQQVSKIEWSTAGYTLNNKGHVAGLGLFRCKLNSLNRIIRPLKMLKCLTILELDSNQISDISFLKDFENITELSLGTNQISDISVLKDLKKLKFAFYHLQKIIVTNQCVN